MTRQPPLRGAPPRPGRPRGRDVVSRAAGNTVSSRRGVRVVARGCATPDGSSRRLPGSVPRRSPHPRWVRAAATSARDAGAPRRSSWDGWAATVTERDVERALRRVNRHILGGIVEMQGVPVPRAQLELGGGDARVPLHRLAGDARAPGTLIFLHGFSDEAEHWKELAELLVRGVPGGCDLILPGAPSHPFLVGDESETSPRGSNPGSDRPCPRRVPNLVELRWNRTGGSLDICSSPNKRREARRPGRPPRGVQPGRRPRHGRAPRNRVDARARSVLCLEVPPRRAITRRRPRRASRAHTPSVSPSPRTFDARRRPRYCATGERRRGAQGVGAVRRARFARDERESAGRRIARGSIGERR